MDKSVFKTLEFDKILNRLASFTESEQTKTKILNFCPFSELSDAKDAQKETTEAVTTIIRIGSTPVSLSVADPKASVSRSEIGGLLNPRELLNISRLLYISRRIKSYLDGADDNCEILHSLADGIIVQKPLEDVINAAILSETEIADDASADLLAIRRKKASLNAKIKDTLNSMIRSETYKKYLQDQLVTLRSGRYVIPVRAEYRGEVQGIVHDSSASGATLFIEPMSVVNANNEIRDLENKEEVEIEKILSGLSAQVAENSAIIKADYEIIARLDFIFCKAKLSLDMKASEPILNDEGIIEFKKARHPLIDPEKVIANDIFLGENFDTLVITGPNTGGKTVTLKTIGLFSIMAASGLHIPAFDGSRAAIFKKFFADIGDEQSIEQSLSTFSSHMVKIVKILEEVDEHSLALFDELGAGTDPTEGAALAISILEHLREKGAISASTTHYSELKIFALSKDGVENASCEFDVDTLRPTYKLLIGIPGKSNAFAISKRLGLSDTVITRANEILSDEDIKFEDVITDLEVSRKEAEAERAYASRMKSELADLKREIDTERKKLKESKAKILENARREAKIIVMEAKEESNQIIKELERLRIEGKVAGISEKASAVREKLKAHEGKLDNAMKKSSTEQKVYAKPPKNLKVGETVSLLDHDNQQATILKAPDQKGMVRVQAGIIKLDVHVSRLARVKDNSSKEIADKYIKKTAVYVSSTKNVSTEIDVRGQLPEEAIMNVGKFIDDCYLAGVSPVTVIHGKGTGVLKAAVGELLKSSKCVKSYRPGRFGEGEMGVTVVELN